MIREISQMFRGKSVATRHQPIERRAQRVQIGALVERLAIEGFRSHERRRSHHHVWLTKRCKRAKIDELHAALRRAPKIAQTHIAVHQASCVEQRQTVSHTTDQAASLWPRRRLGLG